MTKRRMYDVCHKKKAVFYSPDYQWIPGLDPGPDEVEGSKVVCPICYELVVDDMIRKQNERLKRRGEYPDL
jgi:hypothetical protein